MTNVRGIFRYTFTDPHPETIGLATLSVSVPVSFQGYGEIRWRPLSTQVGERDQRGAEERQITCKVSGLLQGVFRDASGDRPDTLFDARVVALVIHAFYRTRIEAAARLEAAYTWHPLTPEDLSPPKARE